MGRNAMPTPPKRGFYPDGFDRAPWLCLLASWSFPLQPYSRFVASRLGMYNSSQSATAIIHSKQAVEDHHPGEKNTPRSPRSLMLIEFYMLNHSQSLMVQKKTLPSFAGDVKKKHL